MSDEGAGAARGEKVSAVGLVAALVSMVCWGLSAVIGRATDLEPLVLVFYRVWMAALFAVIVLRVRGGRVSWQHLRMCALGGLGFGFDLMLFFTALEHTTVANTTVITTMVPLPMLFIAPRLFGERIDRADVLWAGVALVGVAVLVFGSTGLPVWSPGGDLVAVGALLAWTVYVVTSKRTRDRVDALSYTTHTAIIAALVVTPFAAVSGQDLSWPDWGDWFWVAMSAIGVGWGAHVLMNIAVGRIPIWLASTLQLGIPVSSTVLVALFLDEPFVLAQGLGMGLAIAAMTAMVLRSQHRPAAVPPGAAVPTAATEA
jgi:drug/metabolite transporter (DMT)-like permease